MIIAFRRVLILSCVIFCITACNHNNKEVQQQGQHKDSAAHAVVDTITPKLRDYSQRIASNPRDADAYWNRGKLEVMLEKLGLAATDFNIAIHIDSTKADYYYNLADLEFIGGHTREAKNLFEKCVVINSQYAEALLKLGEIYFYVRKYKDAIDYIDKALKVNPYSGRAYFMKGMIFLEKGDTAKAVSSMQTAVEQDTKYFDAYIQLGLLYAHKGSARALDYFNDAINIQPNNVEPYYDKGMFYQSINDYGNAMKAYTQLLGMDSTYKFALYNMGVINYVGMHDYKQALQYFDKAVRQDTSYAMAYYGRANCFDQLGQYENALLDYSHVLYLKPKFKEAQTEYMEMKKKLHR